MRLLFLLITGILAVFPLYSNENGITEQSESNEQNNLENFWIPLFGINSGYSFGKDTNFIIELDLTIVNPLKSPFVFQTFGLEYQYLYSQSIIRMDYTYTRFFLAFGGGIGISSFYNINNNDIGIAPKIGVSVLVPNSYILIRLNYYFRYNFVLNNVNNSYHENIYSASVSIPMNN